MNALVAARDDALQAFGAALTQVIATQVAVLVAASNGEEMDEEGVASFRREAAEGSDKKRGLDETVAASAATGSSKPKPLPPAVYECPGNTETGAPCATPDEPAHPSKVKHKGENYYVCMTDRKGIERARKERAKERKKQKVQEQVVLEDD